MREFKVEVIKAPYWSPALKKGWEEDMAKLEIDGWQVINIQLECHSSDIWVWMVR